MEMMKRLFKRVILLSLSALLALCIFRSGCRKMPDAALWFALMSLLPVMAAAVLFVAAAWSRRKAVAKLGYVSLLAAWAGCAAALGWISWELLERDGCVTRVHDLLTELHCYANDHGGQFPPDLETLWRTGAVDNALLACRNKGGGTAESTRYTYFSGLTSSDSFDCVVILDPPEHHYSGAAIVGFRNGYVEVMRPDKAHTLCQQFLAQYADRVKCERP